MRSWYYPCRRLRLFETPATETFPIFGMDGLFSPASGSLKHRRLKPERPMSEIDLKVRLRLFETPATETAGYVPERPDNCLRLRLFETPATETLEVLKAFFFCFPPQAL